MISKSVMRFTPPVILWAVAILILVVEITKPSFVVQGDVNLATVLTILGIFVNSLAVFVSVFVAEAVSSMTLVDLQKGLSLKELSARISVYGSTTRFGFSRTAGLSMTAFLCMQILSISYKNLVRVVPATDTINLSQTVPTAGSSGSDTTGPLFFNTRTLAANLTDFVSKIGQGQTQQGSGFMSYWEFSGTTTTSLNLTFLDAFDVEPFRSKGYLKISGAFPGQRITHKCEKATTAPTPDYFVRSGYAALNGPQFKQYVLDLKVLCSSAIEHVMLDATLDMSGPAVLLDSIQASKPRTQNLLYAPGNDTSMLFSTIEQLIFYGVNDKALRSDAAWSKDTAKVRLCQRVAVAPYMNDLAVSTLAGADATIKAAVVSAGTRLDFSPNWYTHGFLLAVALCAIGATLTAVYCKGMDEASVEKLLTEQVTIDQHLVFLKQNPKLLES